MELLNDLRVQAHKNPVTPNGRQSWLKSARIMLVSQSRPFEEVCTLIRWACEDRYWADSITSVYKLQDLYAGLLEESKSRKPRRARAAKAFEDRDRTISPGSR